MAQPTLTELFGTNATQNATTITISKADLTGLNATSSNSAESLLVAILLKAKSYLTESNFDSNIDQSITITDGFSSLTTRNNTSYRQDQLTVTMAKIDTSSTIDPDDY